MVKLEPLPSSERLYIRVARRIADLVKSGEVKPGDRLPSERVLADMLQVSRPSIREAMIALELSGLIEVRTGSGIFVTSGGSSISTPLVDSGVGPFEILEMRLLLEPEICALAAERISDGALQRLSELFQSMVDLNGRPEMEVIDREFHTLIATEAENTAMAQTVEWLWRLRLQSGFSRSYHRLIVEEGIFPTLEEHKAILDALMKRDPGAARQAMTVHLQAATESAARHFEGNPV